MLGQRPRHDQQRAGAEQHAGADGWAQHGEPALPERRHQRGGGLTAVAGRTVLSGNNSYSGATIVQTGAALGFAGSALNGTSGIQVAAGGELQIVNSNVVTTLNKPIALGGRSAAAPALCRRYSAPSRRQCERRHHAHQQCRGHRTGWRRCQPRALCGERATDCAGQALRLRTTGPHNTLAMGTISGPGSCAAGLTAAPLPRAPSRAQARCWPPATAAAPFLPAWPVTAACW